jgi:mannose-6-phosphate isomerase-like protein (cupin superfamily)
MQTVKGQQVTQPEIPQRAEGQAKTFQYIPKDPGERPKGMQMLCRTDILFGAVQHVKSGGETNLHTHNLLDGFWFVLKGRAKFYTTNDEVIADLGPYEGVLLPRGFPYWFERGDGPEDLEILQVEASARSLKTVEEVLADRVDLAPREIKFSDEEVVRDWEKD